MAKKDSYSSIFPITSLYTYITTQEATRDLALLTDASSKRLNSILIFLHNRALNFGKFYGLCEPQMEICFRLILSVFIDGKGAYVQDELKEDSFKRFSELFSNLHQQNEKFTGILTDFFTNVYQHFHLYQWVIENERELDLTKEEFLIEAPDDQLCKQASGVSEKEFEMQQKSKELDLAYSQKFEKIESTLNEINSNEQVLNLAERIPDDLTGVSKDDIDNITDDAAKYLRESVSGKLACELDSKRLKLEHSIDLLALESSNAKVKK